MHIINDSCDIDEMLFLLQLVQVLYAPGDQLAEYVNKMEMHFVNFHVLLITVDVPLNLHVQSQELHVLLVSAVHHKLTVKVRLKRYYINRLL